MQLINAARHTVAEATTSTDKHGREHLLIVIKATYRIPANGKTPRPLLPPQPLAMKDTFVGEPGLSAQLYENDFASTKQACDVLFDAQAHAPSEVPVTHLDVAVRVGSMSKALRVVGDRTWEKDLLLIRAGVPNQFVSMPLHYGRAFGGTVAYQDGDDVRCDCFEENPFGTGYSKQTVSECAHGLPLPNLERKGRPISRPDGEYPPVALSVMPRNAPSRRRYAGTYDQHWRKHVCPFLPTDFDERFFQSAPPDQQIPFPTGGEEVTLINMMPKRPEVFFRLPRLDNMPVKVLRRDYSTAAPPAHVDTLFFEPDTDRFSVVWRATLPLGMRGIREISRVALGPVCQKWWDAVSLGASGCQGCSERRAQAEAPEGCPDSPDSPAVDPHAAFTAPESETSGKAGI